MDTTQQQLHMALKRITELEAELARPSESAASMHFPTPGQIAALRKVPHDPRLALPAYEEGWNDAIHAVCKLIVRPSTTPSAIATSTVELGCPGHLIVANRCRWKRHTQVGNYRVSSIGDYYPDGERGKRDRIGGSDDAFFETMVFKTTGEQDKENDGCGCHRVAEWSEIDAARYATAGEAQAGHERFIAKYREIK